jgi:hypothetical protein
VLGAGLAVWGPGALAVAVVGALPGPFKLLALIMFASLLAWSFVGVAALAARVGDGIPSPQDRERPWLPVVRGIVCLEVPATLPFLGWFVLVPGIFLAGAGAAARAAWAPVPAVTPAPAPAPAGVSA